MENQFGLVTRSRLLELSDLQRPLLRKLASEAPGTFEHTLMISSLAEEGVRAIGGDIDLARTGSLYHDIGKLHAPQWFIENQSGTNPHEHLNDPWRSAEILQAHVDEGLKLAQRYKLPKPVAHFIPEHQGTLRMGFFLHKAREQNPNASDKPFRYRGPRPHSKETAVLMLADGCEAALRSMPPETNETEAHSAVRRGGFDVAPEMLKTGMLFVHDGYLGRCDDLPYAAAETTAKELNVGVWNEPGGIKRPWDLRLERNNSNQEP